jgi:hypothetical protein
MNMLVLALTALLAVTFIGGGYYTRWYALRAGTPTWGGILMMSAGVIVLIGGIVLSLVIPVQNVVGTTLQEVAVVSRSANPNRFNVTLRNVETGKIYNEVDVGRRGRNGRVRCANGPQNLQPGMQFTARINIWENEGTKARFEHPDDDDLQSRFC